jgi:hypothetical protein
VINTNTRSVCVCVRVRLWVCRALSAHFTVTSLLACCLQRMADDEYDAEAERRSRIVREHWPSCWQHFKNLWWCSSALRARTDENDNEP